MLGPRRARAFFHVCPFANDKKKCASASLSVFSLFCSSLAGSAKKKLDVFYTEAADAAVVEREMWVEVERGRTEIFTKREV